MSDGFNLDHEGHRRRLRNVAWAEQAIHGCLRRHLVTNYIPGHVTYNLGEYPWREPYDVDERDAERLQWYASRGVGLVQVHEEWNDSQRLYGGDKLSACRPEALRRFIAMAHDCGMKVLLYVSTGYFERTDPDFNPDWDPTENDLVELYFRYAHCSPASPWWRAYLLPRLARILDEYEVDGLYNDWGYRAPTPGAPVGDEILAFEESESHGGAIEDLLSLIYARVKSRGGIVKLHCGGASPPPTRRKVYDYLWVGEGVQQIDLMRDQVKGFEPYVCPRPDLSRAQPADEDEVFVNAIPYLQFPLLMGGKPITGERLLAENVRYRDDGKCFWTQHVHAIREHYLAHPEGPHSYGWWDSCPGRDGAQEHHLAWLGRYRPLIREGTVAYLEVGEGELFERPLPKGVVASVFVREDAYLVLANYRQSACEVRTRDAYRIADVEETPRQQWTVSPRTLLILQRDDPQGT